MKYNKRIAAVALACALLATGCGQETPETASSSAVASSTVTESSQAETNVSQEATAPSEETPVQEPEKVVNTMPAPIALIGNYMYEYFNDESAPDWWGATSISTPLVISEGYDNLQKSLISLARDSKTWADHFRDNVNEAKEEGYLAEEFSEWSEDVDYEIYRSDAQAVSFFLTESCYLGGAHPSYYLIGMNFDSNSGKELSLKDVAKDYDKLEKKVIELAGEDEDWYFDEWKTTIKEEFANESVEWILGTDKIVIVFNVYEIAPYAAGPIMFDIPFEGNEDILNMDYAVIRDRFFQKLDVDYMSQDVEYDFDGDGELEVLTVSQNGVYYEEDDYYPMYYATTIEYGKKGANRKAITYEACDGAKQMAVCETKGGKFYLLVDYSEENDWHNLVTYDLNKPNRGAIDLGYCEYGGLGGFNLQNPDDFFVSQRVHMMGTYGTYLEVALDDDGYINVIGSDERKVMTASFIYLDEDPNAYTGEPFSLTVIQNFNAKVSGTNQDVTLKVGEKLYPYSTNCDKRMTFKRENGDFVDVFYDGGYDEENYGYTIDGVSEYLLMEDIIYAG